MAVNLFDLAKDYLTPDAISKIASVVGESPAGTQKALDTAIPTLAAVACNRASTPSGAAGLLNLISPGKLDPGILTNFAGLLGGGSSTDGLLKTGAGLISALLGANAGGVSNLIAKAAGIGFPASSSLLNLAAPLVLGLLGKQVAANGLSASGLSSFLSSHRDTILRNVPQGLAGELGLGSNASLCAAPESVRPVATVVAPEPQSSRWWLWLLPLLALLLGFLGYRSCSGPKSSLASLSLPCGTVLSVEENSFNYNLATFLMKGSDSELPKRIVFDNLNFDTASTRLTPESNPTVTNLIAILKCFPNSQILLEGHTDSTGDAAANKKLSLDRSNAVKDLLVAGGVDGARISTDGWGQEKPVASNDTDEGRARNRRTELIVNKR